VEGVSPRIVFGTKGAAFRFADMIFCLSRDTRSSLWSSSSSSFIWHNTDLFGYVRIADWSFTCTSMLIFCPSISKFLSSLVAWIAFSSDLKVIKMYLKNELKLTRVPFCKWSRQCTQSSCSRATWAYYESTNQLVEWESCLKFVFCKVCETCVGPVLLMSCSCGFSNSVMDYSPAPFLLSELQSPLR